MKTEGSELSLFDVSENGDVGVASTSLSLWYNHSGQFSGFQSPLP